MALADISSRFVFREWTTGKYFYKEASGDLGVPGKVMTHRIASAQREVSSGTGEHAGHLIGIQFGAPGVACNLGLQNPNMNTFAPKALQNAFRGPGGSYHNLESHWAELLQRGYRIYVTVRDTYRAGEMRPFCRSVHWKETAPNTGRIESHALDFGNFSSPQARAAGA